MNGLKSLFFIAYSFLLFNNSFAQQPRLMLPIGHTDGITSAHFSPDWKKVVTVSDDRTAKIWDVETGVLLADLKGHVSKVNFAEFSPDGKKIVTASSDYKLNIWNVETGQLDTVLTGHTDEILSARFSPDGKKIITASDDNTARIWDLNSGKCDAVLTRHINSVHSAEFSPVCPEDPAGGRRFLTASSDSTALLWDTKTDGIVVTIREQAAGLKFAHFSSDGKKILTVSFPKGDIANTKIGKKNINDPFQKKDSVKIKVWNALTGGMITELKGYTPEIWSAWFSPDGKKILTASQDQTAKIWDAATGEPDTAYEHDDAVISARYDTKGTRFVTVSGDAAKIWDAGSGKMIAELKGHTSDVRSAEYSFDGKKIITASADHTAKIWDAGSGKLLVDLKGHTSAVKFARYFPDGKKIITISADSIARIWDVLTGKFIACLNGVNYNSNNVFNSISFSKDGKKILTASYDNSLQLWDSETGKLDSVLTGNESSVNAALFSPDSTKMIIASVDKTPRVKIWDPGSRQFELLRKHTAEVNAVAFSPDGTKMVTASSDSSAIFWSGKTREYIKTLTGHKLKINTAAFSPDGKKMITASLDNYIRIWDAETGKTDTALYVKGSEGVKSAWFSPDGKKFITHNINFITVWNAETRERIAELPVNKNAQFTFARSSPDLNSKKIVTISDDNTVKLWDTDKESPGTTLTGHENTVNSAEFSPDGKNIITASDDNMVKIWDAQTGKVLYTFFAVDSIDYLVIDKDNHYDGTDAAIKLLNFIRGAEIISLAQVKGPLWIPDLAERLNTGDIIKERSLEDLDAFNGAIPQIEINQEGEKEYRFSIQPGRGGLGEIILFVNDIEARRFYKENLINHNGVYELRVNRDSLNKYFVSDEDNWISLKAKTKDNSLSSEEAKISFDKDTSLTDIKPNLYAVMVGTSQYKELPKKEESIWGPAKINLKYPAVDAHAVSQTVESAAKNKLGKDHVFMYNLTTDSADFLKPNKQTIKIILDSIGKLATANDILLIFLSGHGVVSENPGSKKQFYYMTSDAASLTDETTYREVGISTDTLLDWIKLENIAANKRILILDACYSGQVINDLKKDIDRLKENSKMFILSASASNQSAFESETYSHGHLAYSLLKAIKQQPDILEDGTKLNISRWFNAAGKLVSAMAEEENNTQKTHIFTVVDFDIGVVDPTLIKNIRLKQTKPLFISSNFQNADKLDDDSGFSNSVNKALREIYEGPESKIKYEDASAFADAYKISGRYTLKGNNAEVKFMVTKGSDTIKIFDVPVKGTKDDLPALAKKVAKLAADWVSKIIEPL